MVNNERPLTPNEVVQCVVWYFYNRHWTEQYEAASGNSIAATDKEYLEEKALDYRSGLPTWFNRFDSKRQKAWVAAAITAYEKDARLGTELCESMEN